MNSHTVPLSIVVIAYNEEAYIGRCLEAIKNQTVAPDEVIVVNNNSTDRTAEIARSYPFVKVIDEHEQGMIPARDAGFNVATGDLLARIDADTQLPPEWTKKVHMILDAHAHTICGVSGPHYFYEFENRIVRRLSSDVFSRYGFFGVSKLMLGHDTLFGSNMVITRSAWNKVKREVCHNSHAVHEDIDLALHIGEYGSIIFDHRLVVGVSARPLREGRKKQAWRLKTWVKTVTHHRKLFSGPTKV